MTPEEDRDCSVQNHCTEKGSISCLFKKIIIIIIRFRITLMFSVSPFESIPSFPVWLLGQKLRGKSFQ